MNRRKMLGGGAVLAAAAVLLAGCASPQLDDLKGVQPVYPDYAVVIMNVSSFPNIGLLCYDGNAELTTTRDLASITYAPQFDNICAAHKRNDVTAANGVTPPREG